MFKERKVSREQVLAAIQKAASSVPKNTGKWKALGMRTFFASSGLRRLDVYRHFSTWNQALEAAGLDVAPQSRSCLEPEQLLEDWGLVARKLQRLPSHTLYNFHGKFCARTLQVRFDGWSNVRRAFREFAKGKEEWADVERLCDITPQEPRGSSRAPQPPRANHAPKLREGRLLYGEPLGPPGLGNAPTNENGVILVFGMLAAQLGFHIQSVKTGFPDCEALRRVGTSGWQNVTIEFEFQSYNFHQHGHSQTGCDLIVCWEHNWADCPPDLGVIALRDVIVHGNPGLVN